MEKRQCLVLASLLLAGSVRLGAEELVASASLEQFVREAYGRLEMLTAASRKPASIRVSRFVPGGTKEIAGRPVTELWSLDLGVTTHLNEQFEHTKTGTEVSYELSFRDSDLQLERVPTYNLDQAWIEAQAVKAQARAKNEGGLPASVPPPTPLDQFDRFLQFEVDLHLAGRDLHYRAIAFERTSHPPGMVIVDPVLWMVNQAKADSREPAIRELFRPEPAADAAASVACSAWDRQGMFPDQGGSSNADGHWWGSHSASAYANELCTCLSSCRSLCNPVGSGEASDDGLLLVPGMFAATGGNGGGSRGEGAPGQGSRCDVVGGACVRHCFLGIFCDVSIGIGAVEVQLPNDCVVEATAKKAGNCPPCTPVAPRKKRARKACRCTSSLSASLPGLTSCSVEATCEDLAEGDPNGFDTCEEAIAAEPDPDCSGTTYCGDGICNGGENSCTCQRDCGGSCCGNFTCEFGESCSSCPFDCGSCGWCGDGTCGSGESQQNCCRDCGCSYPYQCDSAGGVDACTCVGTAYGECGWAWDGCRSVWLGDCPWGQTCQSNYCQGDVCDLNGDGWVETRECQECALGFGFWYGWLDSDGHCQFI